MIYAINKLFKESLQKETVKNYIEDKEKIRIRLDVVSNPLGASKKVMDFLHHVSLEDISKYPDLSLSWELKERIALANKVRSKNILLTAGADHAIEVVLTHILSPKEKIGIHIPTFPRFEIVAKKLCNAEIIFFTNLASIPNAKVIMLCSPNNPTTEEIPKQILTGLLKQHKNKLFVIDAVFSDFGTWNPAELIEEFENLIVIKSFSKSFGIPGARVGSVAAQEPIIHLLTQGISPFFVSALSQKIASLSLEDKEHIEFTKIFLEKEFIKLKAVFENKLTRKANVPFFLMKVKNSGHAKESLEKQGIAVITEAHFRGLEKNILRVKIGNSWENDFFIECIKSMKI